MAGAKRDLVQTSEQLKSWFEARLGHPAQISDLSIPKAGFSNETILGQLTSEGQEIEFVVRIEPTGHQLFLEPDALFQARMMKALANAEGVPVPRVLFEESDSAVLGSAFFVMERVHGRIPSDTPSWHAGGWTTELSPAERGRLYDNGIAAMVALHALDWRENFGFLEREGTGTALDRYLDHVTEWHGWSKPSLLFHPERIDAALDYVRQNRPADADALCVTWGDARVGNVIYGDDLEVAALLDWEGAVLGPPGLDVAWWLMFEDFFSIEQGTPRLEGVAGPEATLARYEQLSGRKIPDILYYQILAGLIFSLINSRLADLYIKNYGAKPENARVFIDRTTQMIAAWLERAKG
jgi:aminoglycoside phosphotransferase (APT) family kinase protein